MRELFEINQPENPMEAARRGARPILRRRFYESAAVVKTPQGYALQLDGKPVHTPAPAAGDDREPADRDLTERPGLGSFGSFGRGLADGDGPIGHAAHHHALQHGLAAEGGVAHGRQWLLAHVAPAAVHLFRPGLTQPAVVRALRRPLATRRWKRSTRPPVSTSF